MNTKTKKLSAGALSEVDCTWVSLVRRGANRQPIKIHKSEDGNETMKNGTQQSLDLAQIGATALKSEGEQKPVLVAAIVKKGEGERVSELLKAVEGLEVVSVTKNEENDCDVINFVEGAQMDENCIAYKHDENLVLIVGGIKASTCKMDFWADSTSFKDNIQKTSFFPSLHEASYTLVDTIRNIMYDGDTSDVVTKADSEIKAFGEYVGNLVKALPVKVMKSLEAIDFNTPQVEEQQEAAKAEGETSEQADGKAEGTVSESAAKTEEQEPAAKSEGEAEEQQEAASAEDAPKQDAAKSDEAPAWAVALTKKMDDMASRLEQVESTTQEAAKKAEEAVEATQESQALVSKAENVLSAARGTVVADAPAGEEIDDDIIPDHNNDDLKDAGIELY